MSDQPDFLAIDRAGWNHVAPLYHGRTALPDYGPLAPTEDRLRLLDPPSGMRVLELGCGSGHSLRWLADGRYVLASPYTLQGPDPYDSWKGVPIVIQRRMLSTWVNEVVRAGLRIEALVEGELDTTRATEEHADPSRWYSIPRARMMPTTFILKSRKPA